MSRWLGASLGGVVLVPIEANKHGAAGPARRDLEAILGRRARRRGAEPEARSLSVGMIRRLHDQLGISADLLIRPVWKSAA